MSVTCDTREVRARQAMDEADDAGANRDHLGDLVLLLARAYLRLIASRGGRHPTADSASNREKSLDLSAEQSDELAMSDRRRRRRA